MPDYFLIDDGRSMARWCEAAHDDSGNDVWLDFKHRRIPREEGRPLAHVEGPDIRCTIEGVPDAVAWLEQSLAWERLVDPWSDQGWIAPDGRFYGCRYYAHDDLAYALLRKSPYALEHEGWIRVHADTFRTGDGLRRVTSRQERTLLALGFASAEPGSGMGRSYEADRASPPPRFAARPPRGTVPVLPGPSSEPPAPPGEETLARLADRLSTAEALSHLFGGEFEAVPDVGPGTWMWMLRFDGMDIGGEEHPEELLRSPGLHLRATSFDTAELSSWPFEEIRVDPEAERLARAATPAPA